MHFLIHEAYEWISVIDIGIVPGYAYVNRIENWQFSAFAGFGGVIQSKIYQAGQLTRGFLGTAPRVDLRFIAGYSKPDYFFWFVSDFDIKSIKHQDLRYRQTYYSLKLVAGIRFDSKKKSGKKS